MEQIVEAARAASVHDFIESLPEGYETQVGERGQTLSAGERQRIALARVLLQEPSVIVLDEPTASLDPLTERRIAASLSGRGQSTEIRGQTAQSSGWGLGGKSRGEAASVALTPGPRTTIVISHRLSLIEMADLAIVIEGGKVVECGPPVELLARGAALASLFGTGVEQGIERRTEHG